MPDKGTNVRELERYIDYSVLDQNDSKVGDVEAVWEDSTGDPAFLSVRTGWLGFGRAHVVPADAASVSEQKHAIRLPYTKDVIKNAPSYDADTNIDAKAENEIYDYYRGYGFSGEPGRGTEDSGYRPPPMPESTSGAGLGELSGGEHSTVTEAGHEPSRDVSSGTEEERTIPLKEEQLNVEKREHNSGVRVRKVVRTETVNKPVELEREELVVERANVDRPTDEQVGTDEDVFIPLRREEAVAHKDTKVREEVHIGKQKHREHQDIHDEVKKEDVDIQDTSENPEDRSTRH